MNTSEFAPIIRDIVINMGDDNYCYEIAPQGDGRNRYLNMTLMFDGEPYTIASGSTAIFEGTNAGGYTIFNPCTIIGDNVIRVSLGNGVLSFPGQCQFRVSIYSEGGSTSGFNLYLFVTECPYDVIKLQAADSYEALTDLISSATKIINNGIMKQSVYSIQDIDKSSLYYNKGYVDKSITSLSATELTDTILLSGTVINTDTTDADSQNHFAYIWLDSSLIDINENYDFSFFSSIFSAFPTKIELKTNPITLLPSLYMEFPKAYVNASIKVKLRKCI